MRKDSKVQELVNYYKTIKKYDSIENWDKVYYKMNLKPAKQLLTIANEDLDLARQAIKEIGEQMDGWGFTNWSLWAIVRNYPKWFLERKNKRPESGLLREV